MLSKYFLKRQISSAWILQSQNSFQDFNLTSEIYTHKKTHAQLQYLKCEDVNKSFSCLLKTTPQNSKGAPHILEHLVLMGSQNYPVKDVFFQMLKRTMSNFMNAFTGNDFTMYPFSTIDNQDFTNLIRIYLDCVFLPLLRERDFWQEGFRIDLDENGLLKFNGVVYNEMKGFMSNPLFHFQDVLLQCLFTKSSYKYNAGGDPQFISDFTYQELKQFHQKFYHPSNSKIYLYGDLDVQYYLDLIDKEYLSKFNQLDIDSKIELEPRWTKPKEFKIQGPLDAVTLNKQKQHRFCISWLCNHVAKEPYESFKLLLLSEVFFKTQNSPFHKVLLDSGLGTNFVPLNGFSNETQESFFTIGVVGTNSQEYTNVEKVIFDTLKELKSKGVDLQLIQAALHRLEVRIKEVKQNQGLNLIQTIFPYWLYGDNPETLFMISQFVHKFNQEMTQFGDKIFSETIEKYFLSNTHHAKILVEPDENYLQNQLQWEQEKLKVLEQTINKESVKQQSEILNKQQISNESVLPELKLSQINSQEFKYEIIQIENLGVKGFYLKQPTNGINYVRFKVNIENINESLMEYVPLFCDIFDKLGTNKHSHGQFSNLKQLYTTNGFETSILTSQQPYEESMQSPKQLFSAKLGFLSHNDRFALDLLSQICLEINFNDLDLLEQLIQRTCKEKIEKILYRGDLFAANLAASSLTRTANLYNQFDYLQLLCKLSNQLTKSNTESKRVILQAISKSLQNIWNQALKSQNIEIIVHSDKDKLNEQSKDQIKELISQIKEKQEQNLDQHQLKPFVPFYYQRYLKCPTQVNHVTQCFSACTFTHSNTPSLFVLSELLSKNYLHEEIREKNNAYGYDAELNWSQGVFKLSTYRDPRQLDSYDSFKYCIEQVTDSKFSTEQLSNAKISTVARILKPIVPADRGILDVYLDLNYEMRQKLLNQVMEVSAAEIQQSAHKYLYAALQNNKSSKVVLGSQEIIDKRRIQEENWEVKDAIKLENQ